jgi:hypothetical protein
LESDAQQRRLTFGKARREPDENSTQLDEKLADGSAVPPKITHPFNEVDPNALFVKSRRCLELADPSTADTPMVCILLGM